MLRKWLVVFGLTLLLAEKSRAGDWPNWRGPARNGVSEETEWLQKWPDAGPPVAWKATVGLGFSSIVVENGKAVTVGHADGKDTIFCFDAVSGKEIWKYSYPSDLGDKYFEGGTTGTPTIDGNKVHWLSRWGNVFCLELANGKVVWARDFKEISLPDWGFTGAPLVSNDWLILNMGESGLALDKNSGKILWQSQTEGKAGYSTPLPVSRGGKTEVLIGNYEGYVAINPADGKEIWRMKWLTQYGVNAADPIPYGDRIFISSGYGKGAALIKPVAGGEPEVVWKNRVLRTQLNPAVLVGKYLYGVDGDTTDKASLKCVEIETGKEVWAEANFGSGGVMVADNKLIALAARGELMIAPVTPEGFKPIARAQVLGGKSWTAPVLANGLVYCRNSRGDIVAVDLRKK
jgi:outer membrane protein assembly factor BamB